MIASGVPRIPPNPPDAPDGPTPVFPLPPVLTPPDGPDGPDGPDDVDELLPNAVKCVVQIIRSDPSSILHSPEPPSCASTVARSSAVHAVSINVTEVSPDLLKNASSP